MICQNCGTQNNENSKFCIKCGNPMSIGTTNNNQMIGDIQNMQQSVQTMNNTMQQPSQMMNNNMQQPVQTMDNTMQQPSQTIGNNIQPSAPTINYNTQQSMNQTIQTPMQNLQTDKQGKKMSISEYFFTLLAVILKPFTAFKEEINKFNNFQNSVVLSLIVSVFATLVTLVKTMYSAVRVTTGGWLTEEKTEWVWENLKNVEYVKVIGMNLLIYLGIILAIAGVYYIASLVAKKQTNFSRLLGISAIAVAPMLVCSLILSPLLALIWAELAMPITLIGAIYTIVLVYEGMNNEVLVEGNAKYYFNLVCLSILGIAAYYLYMKLFMSSISAGLEDITDFFG